MATRLTRREAERLRHKFPAIAAALDAIPALPPVPTAAEATHELLALGVPVAVEFERGPGRWSVRIANWVPASDNERSRGLKRWMRLKRRDREVVRDWLAMPGGVPRATGRRRLALAMMKRGPMIDPQNCLKSACDALVAVGLLKDDGPDWLELVAPTAVHGKVTSTMITLEDL